MKTNFLPQLQRSFVAVGVSAGLGVAEAGIGLINKGKANKRAKELAASRPKLQSSPYLKDQLSLAESELSTGMSADAKRAYESDMDSSLSASLGTITRMGGSPNDVGSVFASNANGRARLAIMKDNLRLNQINNLSRAQEASEEERQKEFQFNDWAPWADAAKANANDKAAATSEIFGGINTAAGGVMRFDQQKDQSNDFKQYLKTTTSGSKPAASSATPAATPYLDGLLHTGDTGD